MNIALTEAIDIATHVKQGERIHKLTPRQKAISLHLSINSDRKGFAGYSPPNVIARCTGHDLKWIKRDIRILGKYGAVTRHSGAGGRNSAYSTYTLNIQFYGRFIPSNDRGLIAPGTGGYWHPVPGANSTRITVSTSVGTSVVPQSPFVEVGNKGNGLELAAPAPGADRGQQKAIDEQILNDLSKLLTGGSVRFGPTAAVDVLAAARKGWGEIPDVAVLGIVGDVLSTVQWGKVRHHELQTLRVSVEGRAHSMELWGLGDRGQTGGRPGAAPPRRTGGRPGADRGQTGGKFGVN